MKNQKGIVQIAFILILLAGIAALVFLVQKQQIFKSKATTFNEFNAFGVSDSGGNPLKYTDAPGIRTFRTSDVNINIKIDVSSLTGD